ncbi:hypothetical protein MD535_01330 [Vibrio sp. ZSDZ65]|uniref:50S ribosomal protein L33 n=1 Tax=Vibrio qingdaonensis TaxID=2829491 RepID=A0A9X3CJM8_9VIBR|nr:hypothetical protein [Vibrio qingdaonensis]MCW8344668.1 hypothetical protein [Vibrio qingdaonensis]
MKQTKTVDGREMIIALCSKCGFEKYTNTVIHPPTGKRITAARCQDCQKI